MSDQDDGSAARGLATALGDELLTLPEVKSHESRFQGELTFVAPRASSGAVSAVVEKQMGPAAKPAATRASEELRAHPLLGAIGGIRDDQTLYMKDLGAGEMIYVAYWPWGGGARFTIKIGVFPLAD